MRGRETAFRSSLRVCAGTIVGMSGAVDQNSMADAAAFRWAVGTLRGSAGSAERDAGRTRSRRG